MESEKFSKAIDLSHHLSELSRARRDSPLKSLAKYMGKPGLISLAGGMPHPSYFPYAEISASGLAADNFPLETTQKDNSVSWLWKIFGVSSSKDKVKTIPITVPKYPSSPDDVNLATALQYGTAQGLVELQKAIKELISKVYQPAYSNWAMLVDTGNTDGWARAVQTLCNPGEYFLTEEWTYPSALASSRPFNVKPVAVAMDGEGMVVGDLKNVLSGWDEKARGAPRPHVLYTVPVGQNPSGATMGLQRKKEIYDVCVQYDIIIVEDDPYYFLQEGEYKPKSERSSQIFNYDSDKWADNLVPSFLKVDTQGRVIRLDTFSKTIAPGSRLGFFTCNPLFAERLERQGETTTQAPCGFGQALITQLLKTWGHDGYIRWLHGLNVQYTIRRDFLIDSFFDEFHVRSSYGTKGLWKGLEVYDVYAKPKSSGSALEKFERGPKMFSFVPPTSGMFIWMQLNFEEIPSHRSGDEETLEMKLWTNLAEAGVLVAPGWIFAAESERIDQGQGHLRISFANAEYDVIKKAVQVFGKVFRDFFHAN
ncbi:PLP-dependent transferase [Panus rudis PR-1116 ss-1]|nr:PLP-dependent transferase [Panus rudis PR-1116 ss-1]